MQIENGVLASTIAIIKYDRGGLARFALANGQVWEETSKATMRRLLRDGDQISIKESGLGGYRLSSERVPGFMRVKRVS